MLIAGTAAMSDLEACDSAPVLCDDASIQAHSCRPTKNNHITKKTKNNYNK